VTEVVDSMPGKLKALSSNPNTPNKKEKEKKT
jgi:hypothetical protein